MAYFWDSFKDELLLTALLLALLVSGSMFVMAQVTTPREEPQVQEENLEKILGQIDSSLRAQTRSANDTVDVPTPAPTPSESPFPTPDPDETSVNYGNEAQFRGAEYALVLNWPRLTFNNGRQFVMDVRLKNVEVAGGIKTQSFFAEIVKDGKTVSESTPMNVTDSRSVQKGEDVVFQVKLPLMEGTDVARVRFSPGVGVPEVVHELQP